MGETVRFKSGITRSVKRISGRTGVCTFHSAISAIPSFLSGLNLVIRKISAVKTEETES